MYIFDSRVRYSETGEDGRLTPMGVINYFQDCSTFQSEDIGVGVEWLEQKKRAWLLAAWRIVFDRFPKLGERIKIGTFPYGFKGIYGFRGFYIEDESGELVVRADSLWFLYDMEAKTPMKVTEEHLAPYITEQLDLKMERAQRKIPVPADYVEGSPIEVLSHYLDTNHHVNNARYADLAIEAAQITGSDIRELGVEYKQEAKPGDIMYPHISETPDGKVVALCREDGAPFAVVKLVI